MAAHVFNLPELKEETHELGEKVNLLIKLQNNGFLIPGTFIVTAGAYHKFLKENRLDTKIQHLLGATNLNRESAVRKAYKSILKHMNSALIPEDLLKEIINNYKNMGAVLEDAKVHVYFSHPNDYSSHKIQGDTSLLETLKSKWLSVYSPSRPKIDPTIVVQRETYGKHGKIKTSTKQLKSDSTLLKEEIVLLEEMVNKLKKLFYFPQEIDWGIEKGKLYILKIKPETHTENKSFFSEIGYKIIKNSNLHH